MSLDEILHAQDWHGLTSQLAVFAHHRTRKRSWEIAKELAQEAILMALEHRGGWDPEKEPILDHLKRLVVNVTSNENRKKRYSADVVLDEDRLDGLVDERDTHAESLEKRRLLESVYERLQTKLENDRVGKLVLALIVEEVATPREQQLASGCSYEEVVKARERIFYCAARVAAELAREPRAPESPNGEPHGN